MGPQPLPHDGADARPTEGGVTAIGIPGVKRGYR
jgi:hypothetical protein